MLAREGLGAAVARLHRLAPKRAARTDLSNPRRVARALEIAELAGDAPPPPFRGYPAPVAWLGLHVSLARGRKCCGRPAFSQGNLDTATNFGEHNINLLSSLQNANSGRRSHAPIIFLEPSCYSMFAEDYRELKIPGAESIAQRCFLFEKFVSDILQREPVRPRFQERDESVVIHAHCHAKAILDPTFMARLVEQLPGRKAKLLDTGCCGMAGAFGMMESKRDLSLKVAAHLLAKIDAEGPDATVVASGTSCRHQISELSDRRPKHMAEVLSDALT
jgi:Fe-S oxidoreductase